MFSVTYYLNSEGYRWIPFSMNNARYFYYLSLLDHSYSLISPTTPIYFTDYTCYIYIYILHSNYPTFTNTHIHLPLQNTLPTIYYKLTIPILILHFIYTLPSYYIALPHSLTITIIHPYHYLQSLHSVISNIFTVI